MSARRFTDTELERARGRWDVIAADVPMQRKGRELAGRCPFHAEKSPSFYVSPDKGFFHCLSGDTIIQTRQGRRALGDLAGRLIDVLSPADGWQPGFVDYYGRQPLWKISLSRNGVERSILATEGHRWFVRSRQSTVTTRELSIGMRLAATQMPRRAQWIMDARGVAHGIVFGDGSVDRNGFGTVNLHDDKTELVRHFWSLGLGGSWYARGAEHGYLRVYGGRLFDRFKALPDCAPPDGEAYLSGFLAGWIAADGCVDDRGAVSLSSSNRPNLEWARNAALAIGLETSAVREQVRRGYLDFPGPIFAIEFRRSTFDASLLLRSSHRQRFESGGVDFERKRWTVVEVRPTGLAEDVFCAQVPGAAAFGLEDDLLTGNCFGCGAHGTAIDYLMRARGLAFLDAVGELLGLPPQRPRQHSPELIPPPGEAPDTDALTQVREILAGCTPIAERTASRQYLWSRGLIDHFHRRVPSELRHHPSLYCHEIRAPLPALVAPIRNSEGEVTALQRIWVVDRIEYGAKDGRAPLKIRKKTIGKMGDGAVRLEIGPSKILGLAEGVETALAAMRMDRGTPVWSVCGISRFGFPGHWRQRMTAPGERPVLWIPPDRPPPGIDAVWVEERPPSIWIPPEVEALKIYGDNGQVGEAVAKHAAAWWTQHGLLASVVLPEVRFSDFNDQWLAVLAERGR